MTTEEILNQQRKEFDEGSQPTQEEIDDEEDPEWDEVVPTTLLQKSEEVKCSALPLNSI